MAVAMPVNTVVPPGPEMARAKPIHPLAPADTSLRKEPHSSPRANAGGSFNLTRIPEARRIRPAWSETASHTGRRESNRRAERRGSRAGGDGRHFTHPGSAFGTCVGNDALIPSLDDPFLVGVEGLFFVFEDASRSAKLLQIVAGDFYHAAFWSEISFQDDKAAGRLKGRVEFADDFLRRRFFSIGGFLGESASGKRSEEHTSELQSHL